MSKQIDYRVSFNSSSRVSPDAVGAVWCRKVNDTIAPRYEVTKPTPVTSGGPHPPWAHNLVDGGTRLVVSRWIYKEQAIAEQARLLAGLDAPMTFLVINSKGETSGPYEGVTPTIAADRMAQERGFDTFADACTAGEIEARMTVLAATNGDQWIHNGKQWIRTAICSGG